MMKLPIREIIKQEYDVKIDKNEAMSNEYLIKQGDSIIFDQIDCEDILRPIYPRWY